MALTIDDGELDEYTVVGFWFESMKRFMQTYEADTSLAAEEMAQQEARDQFLHLGICGVFKGRLNNVDGYATYVDPMAKSDEEMAMVMEELGLWAIGTNRYAIEASVMTPNRVRRRFFGRDSTI
jgi:hypothetical protein